jgi:hypothetical protein
VFDVAAREAGDRLLVVDYKTDRLEGHDPEAVVERSYALQRLVYALGGLESGAASVEVVHVFLERPEQPASASFDRGERDLLRVALAGAASGVLERRFEVAAEPCRSVCAGCPGEGGLCSWPLEVTRRESLDTLF